MNCPACAALGITCLRCRNLPPSPPERGAPGRCICGGRLRRRVGGWGCPNCGSAFMDKETNDASL